MTNRVVARLVATGLLLTAFAFASLPAARAQDDSSDGSDPPSSSSGFVVGSPIRIAPLDGGVVTVNGSTFRGDLEIAAVDGQLVVVNAVGIEEYLLGLEEIPPTFPAPALEAQVIVSRTAAALALAERGDEDALAVADACDPEPCPDYTGVAAEERAGADAWADAVRETNARVVLSGGRPIVARYHDTAGGRTRPNADVFGGEEISYLRAEPAPFEADAPLYRWSTTLRLADLGQILEAGGIALQGSIRDVIVEDTPEGTGPDFVVVGTDVDDVRVSASDFVDAVDEFAPELFPTLYPGAGPVAADEGLDGRLPETLPSTLFEIEVDGDTATVSGRGSGHLVGMSQRSAQGMAEDGRSTEEILDHFFAGTEIGRATTPGPVRVLLPEAASSVTIGSSDGLRVHSNTGETVVDAALLDWRVSVGDGDTLALEGPPGFGAPLAVTGFSVPLRIDAGDQIPVSFVLSKPARVEVDVERIEGDATAAPGVSIAEGQRSGEILAAGEHVLNLVADVPGKYRVQVAAADGADTVKSDRLTVDVEKSTIGPSLLSVLGLIGLLVVLVLGVFVYRSTRNIGAR